MADIVTFVDAKIGSKKVVVFSKSWCPFCVKAKKALDSFDLDPEDYEVFELDDDPRASAIQDYLQKKTGARSVPRVFINGKFLGGGDETVAAQRNGQLAKMLR